MTIEAPPFVKWMESIVGESLPERAWLDNPVMAAGQGFGSGGAASFFLQRFEERVRRLWAALPDQRPKLLEKLANLGTSQWHGSYAELVAIEFFTRLPYGLKIEVAAPGRQLGGGGAILDGVAPLLDDLYFDVKALMDTTRRVLNNIERDISREFCDVHLDFDYQLDLAQDAIGGRYREFLDSLRTAIAAKESFMHDGTSGVRVRIRYQPPRVRMSEHGYQAYRHAERLKMASISDAHQLLHRDRNLRVLVAHPFFNLTNTNGFGGAQDTFFRALARRTFCELTRDARPLREFSPKADQEFTVADAASRLSALLFLVDANMEPRDSIDPTKPEGMIDAFLFVNPNVVESARASMSMDHLMADAMGFVKLHDDFEHDNY